MQRQAILDLFDQEMRIDAPIPGSGFTRECEGAVVRLVGPSDAAHDNYIVFSRLDEATVEGAIRREIEAFSANRHAFEWKVFAHDRPPDLGDRLLRHGFEAEGKETLLFRKLSDDATTLPEVPDVLIRRIRHPDELADVMAVQNMVWGEDHGWLRDALAKELAEMGDDLEILLADLIGIGPAATSWMRRHSETSFASIWGAATLVPFRRRGIYTALVDRHAATARRLGATLMTVDANDNSRPVLERIGFVPLVEVQGFVWRPPV